MSGPWVLARQCSSSSIPPRKLKWTAYEDNLLIEAVKKYGTSNWMNVAMFVPGRSSKQCRERWIGQLSPEVTKNTWTLEEDMQLIEAHKSLGNKWTLISQQLPGRSPISVKNRWSWLKRRNLPDIIEKNRSQRDNQRSKIKVVFDSLINFDFDQKFREFQETMLMDLHNHVIDIKP